MLSKKQSRELLLLYLALYYVIHVSQMYCVSIPLDKSIEITEQHSTRGQAKGWIFEIHGGNVRENIGRKYKAENENQDRPRRNSGNSAFYLSSLRMAPYYVTSYYST
jgi:hypothetical protein